jgi:hypothetical protein
VGRYDVEDTGADPKVVADLMARRGTTIVLIDDVYLVNELRSSKSMYKHDICVRCGAVVEKK